MLYADADTDGIAVFTPKFREIGSVETLVEFSLKHVVGACVGADRDTFDVGFYGPPTSSNPSRRPRIR